jgi:hypothetical protein
VNITALALVLSLPLLALTPIEEPLPAQPATPWIGVRVCLPKLIVREVFVGTPAEASGIMPGERIYSVHGESNVSDIEDDLRNGTPGDPVFVEVGLTGAKRTVSLVPVARPRWTIPSGSIVYLPERINVRVRPGHPRAPFECHSECVAKVGPCEALTLESHGPTLVILKWGERVLTYDGGLYRRIFLDPGSCEQEAKEPCGVVL